MDRRVPACRQRASERFERGGRRIRPRGGKAMPQGIVSIVEACRRLWPLGAGRWTPWCRYGDAPFALWDHGSWGGREISTLWAAAARGAAGRAPPRQSVDRRAVVKAM
eukprot:2938579-Prymnesium_polylepis.2